MPERDFRCNHRWIYEILKSFQLCFCGYVKTIGTIVIYECQMQEEKSNTRRKKSKCYVKSILTILRLKNTQKYNIHVAEKTQLQNFILFRKQRCRKS